METNKPAHTPEVIFAVSHSADFEEGTYTFQPDKDFKVKAGRFAILADSDYHQLKSQSHKLVRALNDLVTCVRIFQLKNNQPLDWEEFKYAESVLSDCQELDKNARDFFEHEGEVEFQRDQLERERKLLFDELEHIRNFIEADENESTFDEVVRQMTMLKKQRDKLLAALKEAKGYIQGMLGRKRSTFLDELDATIRKVEKGIEQ